MRISLYLDEDSRSNSLVHALRSRGVDTTTALEAQMLGSTDLEQLVWATIHGHVLYSFNIRDFFQLHSAFTEKGQPHAGIILAQQQSYSIGEQMRRLLKVLRPDQPKKWQTRSFPRCLG